MSSVFFRWRCTGLTGWRAAFGCDILPLIRTRARTEASHLHRHRPLIFRLKSSLKRLLLVQGEMGGRRRKKEWRPVVVIRRYSTYSILLPIQSHCLATIPLAFIYCLRTAYHSTYYRYIVSSIRRQLLDAAKNYPMVPCISPLFSGYGHYAVNRFVAVLFFTPLASE